MKKNLIFIFTLVLGILFLNFTFVEKNQNLPNPDEGLNIPADVQVIIDQSCYGCHHTDSKNEKGKKKLNFDSFGKEYSNIKSAGKLKEVAEEVKEEEMPPKKYLDHNPEKALTKEQKDLLSSWALEASETFRKP